MRSDVSLSNAWQVILSYGAPVWAGVFTAISVFAIIVVLSSEKIIFAGQEKKLNRQKRKVMLLQVLEHIVAGANLLLTIK